MLILTMYVSFKGLLHLIKIVYSNIIHTLLYLFILIKLTLKLNVKTLILLSIYVTLYLCTLSFVHKVT